jgi:hypothetical protein
MVARLDKEEPGQRRDSKGFLCGPDRPHHLPLVGTAPAPDRYRDPLPNT